MTVRLALVVALAVAFAPACRKSRGVADAAASDAPVAERRAPPEACRARRSSKPT